MTTAPFGGGKGKPQGDVSKDLMGTVRRAPDMTMLAVLWPSDPHPCRWMVTDHAGSLGYEMPERVAHWHVIGAVPGTPAAGMVLARRTSRPLRSYTSGQEEATMAVLRDGEAL
jgi:hypothetical protein